MEDTYKTLEKPAEGSYRSKGSRFLAYGFPVTDAEEIREILADLKKKYHDARHHCYAYRLGVKKDVFRMYDDGEPSGTAGKPIYGQIHARDLTDTLIVVVRYFGGVLLGTGGLSFAYKSSAANMLSNANIVERFVENEFVITFPYELMNFVMKTLKDEGLVPIRPVYGSWCKMQFRTRRSSTRKIIDRLSGISGLKVEVCS
jgi:uncharacterized YigZ family protein